MRRLAVEDSRVLTVRSAHGDWLMENVEITGHVVSIGSVEWVPSSSMATLHGWACKVGNKDKNRRWESVLSFEELPEDIKKALKEAL